MFYWSFFDLKQHLGAINTINNKTIIQKYSIINVRWCEFYWSSESDGFGSSGLIVLLFVGVSLSFVVLL